MELDFVNIDAVRCFVSGKYITHIINSVAYNDVVKAESEPDKVFVLNRYVPDLLATMVVEIGAVFVTYSTDFVFDGTKGLTYSQDDIENPISVYTDSKYHFNNAVLQTYSTSFFIGTSWVFCMGNNNFNKQVICWSESRETINIVDDQKSSATYSWDLAEYSLELIKTNKFGLYHLSNDGEFSKYDQANSILDNQWWVNEVASRDYRKYYEEMYEIGRDL